MIKTPQSATSKQHHKQHQLKSYARFFLEKPTTPIVLTLLLTSIIQFSVTSERAYGQSHRKGKQPNPIAQLPSVEKLREYSPEELNTFKAGARSAERSAPHGQKLDPMIMRLRAKLAEKQNANLAGQSPKGEGLAGAEARVRSPHRSIAPGIKPKVEFYNNLSNNSPSTSTAAVPAAAASKDGPGLGAGKAPTSTALVPISNPTLSSSPDERANKIALGLDPDRQYTQDQINKRVRELALGVHPDKLPQDATPEQKAKATEQFQRIMKAKDELTSNQDSRSSPQLLTSSPKQLAIENSPPTPSKGSSGLGEGNAGSLYGDVGANLTVKERIKIRNDATASGSVKSPFDHLEPKPPAAAPTTTAPATTAPATTAQIPDRKQKINAAREEFNSAKKEWQAANQGKNARQFITSLPPDSKTLTETDRNFLASKAKLDEATKRDDAKSRPSNGQNSSPAAGNLASPSTLSHGGPESRAAESSGSGGAQNNYSNNNTLNPRSRDSCSYSATIDGRWSCDSAMQEIDSNNQRSQMTMMMGTMMTQSLGSAAQATAAGAKDQATILKAAAGTQASTAAMQGIIAMQNLYGAHQLGKQATERDLNIARLKSVGTAQLTTNDVGPGHGRAVINGTLEKTDLGFISAKNETADKIITNFQLNSHVTMSEAKQGDSNSMAIRKQEIEEHKKATQENLKLVSEEAIQEQTRIKRQLNGAKMMQYMMDSSKLQLQLLVEWPQSSFLTLLTRNLK